MNSKFYKITCITNMHVGNGDINFTVIDREVEKDVLTGYPIINSSGVKGAIREFMSGSDNEVKYFGSKVTDKLKDGKTNKPGHLKFLSARMLARPMRVSSGGSKPYKLVSTNEMLKQAKELVETIKGKEVTNWNVELGAKDNTKVEGYEVYTPNDSEGEAIKMFGLEDIVIMSSEDFKNVDLPVLARNCLENGMSTNLWYEEIVPYKSIFFFGVLENEQVCNNEKKYLNEFDNEINNQMVQFGGNATIGYGLTIVNNIEGKKNE